jgi:hypothetical protein
MINHHHHNHNQRLQRLLLHRHTPQKAIITYIILQAPSFLIHMMVNLALTVHLRMETVNMLFHTLFQDPILLFITHNCIPIHHQLLVLFLPTHRPVLLPHRNPLPRPPSNNNRGKRHHRRQ